MKYLRDVISASCWANMTMLAVCRSGLLALIGIIWIFNGIAIPSQDLEARKGDVLLKAMSQKLASAQTFSFHTTEFHDRLNRSGQKVQVNTERDVLVRRPDGFWTKYTGEVEWEFWYDGKLLTGVFPGKKIYVQREMPPTIGRCDGHAGQAA